VAWGFLRRGGGVVRVGIAGVQTVCLVVSSSFAPVPLPEAQPAVSARPMKLNDESNAVRKYSRGPLADTSPQRTVCFPHRTGTARV
jgi:hypothetical protein